MSSASSALAKVRSKVGVEFADLGEQDLKNIDRPVRVYAVARDGVGPVTKGGSTTPNLPSASRLSLVVLPFVNIGAIPSKSTSWTG